MPVTNIRSKWDGGDLVFYEEASGDTILKIDTDGILNLGDAGEQPQVTHYFELSDEDGTDNEDRELTHKTEILDAWVVKVGAAGSAGGSSIVQVQDKDGNAITDEIDIHDDADKVITRAGEIDVSNNTIEAGDNLRVHRNKDNNDDDNACRVVVVGRRVE